ncbi:MAG: 4'-phosphopantetheinyl transferase superfamily protein [Verrucomicrobiota bacterium]|nr:4'-phosphopantetheinyl transferase superfamily protein [Verrucomicrobiota bacterium]
MISILPDLGEGEVQRGDSVREVVHRGFFWPVPQAMPVLQQGTIHVWAASLEGGDIGLRSSILSSFELNRALRFHFQRDRTRYINGRYLLRQLLAGYLKLDPASISLACDSFGKPRLGGRHHQNLQFNVTHSNEVALFAFSWGNELGIDIEHVRALPDLELIAANFFTSSERQAIFAMPRPLQPHGFFRCWTRKEAFLKAVGLGIANHLQDFEVSIEEKECRLKLHPALKSCGQWHLANLNPAPGFAAAISMKGNPYAIEQYLCSGEI